MAAGWFSVLKYVPWTDVIQNAPKVADGARKLWDVISGKAAPQENPFPDIEPAVSPEPQTLATLEARIVRLEKVTSDMHRQILASSELIKALADQNTQLVRRIETNRVKVIWLSVTLVAVAILALLGLFLVFWWHGD